MATMTTTHETTANISSSRNVRDVAEGIQYLDPEAAPLCAVITKAAKRKRPVKNPKFEWPEKDNLPDKDQVNNGAGYSDSATSIVVDNGAYFRKHTIVNNPRTGENMLVTAISTNTLTVTRAFGSTAGAAIVDNDDLFILGTAYPEGGAKNTPLTHQETYPHNFTQIFRTEIGTTRTQQNTDTYIGKDRPRLRMEGAKEHKIAIERQFLFGERKEDVGDTNAPRRATGGLRYWITENSKDASGTLTEAELEDWLEDVFQNTGGSNTRLLLASPLIVSVLDQLAAGKQQVVPRADTYGVGITQWVTGHGTLMIVKHRLLVNGAGSQGYSGKAFAVEPAKLMYCPLQNSDTKLRENIEDPGDDKWTDDYITECGLQFANPKLHGLLKGVTG